MLVIKLYEDCIKSPVKHPEPAIRAAAEGKGTNGAGDTWGGGDGLSPNEARKGANSVTSLQVESINTELVVLLLQSCPSVNELWKENRILLQMGMLLGGIRGAGEGGSNPVQATLTRLTGYFWPTLLYLLQDWRDWIYGVRVPLPQKVPPPPPPPLFPMDGKGQGTAKNNKALKTHSEQNQSPGESLKGEVSFSPPP